MSKITNDGLTRSGTGCFIAVPMWQLWASKGKLLSRFLYFLMSAVWTDRTWFWGGRRTRWSRRSRLDRFCRCIASRDIWTSSYSRETLHRVTHHRRVIWLFYTSARLVVNHSINQSIKSRRTKMATNADRKVHAALQKQYKWCINNHKEQI